jgi:hypothetical protein
MKSRIIYTFFGLAFLAIITMGNSSGRANAGGNGGTGAPGEGTCANCHSGGNFGTSVDVKLFDLNTLAEIMEYIPGTTYAVELTISTSAVPGGFGFQVTALQDTDNASISTWANNTTSNTQLSNAGGRQYFEQSAVASDNKFNAEWTAPVSGTGNVTFYYAGNAVNGTGSTSGDEVVVGTTSFTELTVSTSGLENLGISLDIFPNPTVENLTLMLNAEESKDLIVNIYNQNGQSVLSENIVTQNGENRFNFEVANYATGVYFVEVTDGQFRTAKRFLKK